MVELEVDNKLIRLSIPNLGMAFVTFNPQMDSSRDIAQTKKCHRPSTTTTASTNFRPRIINKCQISCSYTFTRQINLQITLFPRCSFSNLLCETAYPPTLSAKRHKTLNAHISETVEATKLKFCVEDQTTIWRPIKQ